MIVARTVGPSCGPPWGRVGHTRGAFVVLAPHEAHIGAGEEAECRTEIRHLDIGLGRVVIQAIRLTVCFKETALECDVVSEIGDARVAIGQRCEELESNIRLTGQASMPSVVCLEGLDEEPVGHALFQGHVSDDFQDVEIALCMDPAVHLFQVAEGVDIHHQDIGIDDGGEVVDVALVIGPEQHLAFGPGIAVGERFGVELPQPLEHVPGVAHVGGDHGLVIHEPSDASRIADQVPDVSTVFFTVQFAQRFAQRLFAGAFAVGLLVAPMVEVEVIGQSVRGCDGQ